MMRARRARLRYGFDNALSRGPGRVITYLGLLALAFVLLSGALSVIFHLRFDSVGGGLLESSYQSLLRMLDPGTLSGDEAWPLRALTLLVTLVGIILGGCLIGLIANIVNQRVETLQRGSGRVVESGHSLILGWSPQVPEIISELVRANESERRACVVVLARTEKAKVEDAIRARVRDTRSTRVVVRQGDPAAPGDLERVCADTARSIVAVRDEEGDAGVIKAVLALRTTDLADRTNHVVAELSDEHDARTLRIVSRGRVVTMSSQVVVAEVTAQACHQAGLAAVFTELLSFEGAEIYFCGFPELAGRTYGEAQLAFDASSVIGRLTPSETIELNPAPSTVLDLNDRLIVVAADDSSIVLTEVEPRAVPTVRGSAVDPARPLRTLIIGWSKFGERVLTELDQFLAPGSNIHIQVDSDLVDPAGLSRMSLKRASVTVAGGHGGPEDLLGLREEGFDQVILLAYRDVLSAADADARTLLSLLTSA